MVSAACTGRDSRAFREDHDGEPLGEPLPTLIERLAQRARPGAAIDRDRRQHGEPPSEERYPEQLALQDPDMRRQDHLEGQRLPQREDAASIMSRDQQVMMR